MRALLFLILALSSTGHRTPKEQVAPDRKGNAYTFAAGDGKAVLEWLSPSTFRFCRDWDGSDCSERATTEVEVELKESLAQERLVLQTKYLKVEVESGTLKLRVSGYDGKRLLEDAGPLERTADGAAVERISPPAERFFGLGPRTDPWIESRGRIVPASKPFLLSSLGYGLYQSAPGAYEFDLAATDPGRYRISARAARWFEYYFHFGPSPKEALEEHKNVIDPSAGLRPWHFAVLHQKQLPAGVAVMPTPAEASWESIRRVVRSLVHGSMSAILAPAFDLGPYETAPLPLYRRAMQLASVVPLVYKRYRVLEDEERLPIQQQFSDTRKRLNPFFISYAKDVEARGHPIVHALPLQFPKDVEAGKVEDEFLLGDEILVAPICGPSDRRSVYLPMGLWTDYRTNERYTGRKTVDLEAGEDEPIWLVKNGSILPLAPLSSDEPMALHYFPKLAAEFFVFEPESNDYTKLHAGPAGDQMRLEIESKATRAYEWVVHHLPAVREVRGGGVVYPPVEKLPGLGPMCWYYDRRSSTVHIRVTVSASQQNIVYVSFEEGTS